MGSHGLPWTSCTKPIMVIDSTQSGEQVCPKASGDVVITEILRLPCGAPTSLSLLPLISSFSDLSKTPLFLCETCLLQLTPSSANVCVLTTHPMAYRHLP